MNESINKEGQARLTGAWERKGKFGKFYVGKISAVDLQAAIKHLGNVEGYEFLLSPVTQKQNENSPDMNISLRLPFVKDADAGPVAPVAATGTNGGQRSFYNKKK